MRLRPAILTLALALAGGAAHADEGMWMPSQLPQLAKELKAADPDKDGTIDKAEYMQVVEARFAAANPDKDGTIDCKEASSRAGKALMRLLK